MGANTLADELRGEFGPNFRLVERIASAFVDRPVSVDRMVEMTRIDFATVRTVLEHDGWDHAVARSIVDALPPYLDRTALQPWAAPHPEDPLRERLRAELAPIVAAVPGVRQELDHIQATVDTIVDRALLAARSMDLSQASVLSLGDHDLTSVALAAVEPGCSIAVLDVDEELLSYLAKTSPSIRTLFCDLRLGLPPALVGQFDLVLTDPPYSIAGMSLFVERARAALRPQPSSRVMIAYGYSPRALTPAHAIQQAVLDQDLLIEAMLPAFNHYTGAPAIGMQADLIVARAIPTRRRWLSVSDQVVLEVYSRGPNAVNTNKPTPDGPTVGQDSPAAVRIKPAGEKPSPSRVDRFLYAERPPKLASSGQTSLVIPLDPGLAGMAFRLALAAPSVGSIEIGCAVPIPDPGPGLDEILSARWEWTRSRSNEGETLLFRRRMDMDDSGVGYVADHAMSKMRNAVIEARIRHAANQGHTLSKRDARALLDAAPALVELVADTIVDLPDWALVLVCRFVRAEFSKSDSRG